MAGLVVRGPVLASAPRHIRATLLAVLAAALIVTAGCHEQGQVKVTAVEITGNSALTTRELKRALATRSTGWLPWATPHYFDRATFEADLRRLEAYYADRGYPHARVTGVDVQFNDARDAVRLQIRVEDGEPLIVDSVRYEGFDGELAAIRTRLEAAPIAVGEPRDRMRVRATRDLGGRLLRDSGYPEGVVEVIEEPLPITDRVALVVRAQPGERMVFGAVEVVGLERVSDSIVRRDLAFAEGDLYRESLVMQTQRRLGRLELFDFATVTDRPEAAREGRLPMRVTVAEAPPRRLELGVGYGADDRARGRVEWTHNNFIGGARHAGVEAKWSFLERGARLTFLEPYLMRPDLSLQITGQAWRVNQITYDSQTYGGRALVVYRQDRGPAGMGEPVRYEFRAGYGHEYLRYGINAEALDDLSEREERIALGLDPDTGRAVGTLASILGGASRIALDRPLDPTRGTAVSLQLERAAPFLGGTYSFFEVVGDARGYVPLGSTVLSARVRYGTIAASDPLTVPFSRRYFLGGSASIRGWGRFQVSPLSAAGLPVGGRSMLELSTELRFPVRGRLSGAVFVDAGNVWAGDWETHPSNLRWAVGPGIRYETPIGPVRVDFGYQINPIPGLIINGEPEARRWRLHFSIGPPF
jgi:outer membrane protein insertion porin family/translocation and assembly module TamA